MTVIKAKDRPFNRLNLSNGRREIFTKIFPFALLLCFLSSCLSGAESIAVGSKEKQTIQDLSKFPKEYGEVIYQSNRESSKQLYIIGVEHRDTFTRSNGTNTSKVQAEVYKIGEWLIRNEEVQLLLPEGFFTKKVGKAVLIKSPTEKSPNGPKLMASSDLEKRLANNQAYVNAEMLLKECYECYGLRVRQIEDKDLYEAVNLVLSKLLLNDVNNSSHLPALESELNYLQERRVAAMLQKIPEVINEEFQSGNIERERALFTIGMSHVPDIIKFLNNNRIEIHGPLLSGKKDEDSPSDLNLLKEQFGITVIVPKKLADDERVLKLCGLDKIVEQCRNSKPGLKKGAIGTPPLIAPLLFFFSIFLNIKAPPKIR